MNDVVKGEILAPVGNLQMLTAAVRSGADAVYLGAKDFSARRNAENFTLDELKSAIEYCHIRGVRVYLTLNILIKDSEMELAFDLAKNSYNMGIDGIIIQDLGLARILHEKIPDLKLHASTQMSVHSPSALPILKKLGFTQVVLGREMAKEDIKEFCQKANNLGITTEAFVHGALCMSVSGQCLLSAFLGSRSGNRGLCAGPCRLPFKAPNGTGYDLSLKDLSLLEYIKELNGLGVSSFKIEGRMKRPEYVAAATLACRQALDTGAVDATLAQTLKNVFSRQGFTDGYYTNKLGTNMFGTRTKDDVISANAAFPILHEIYRNERQAVNVNIKAKIKENEPISLTLSDGENVVTATGNIPQKSQNKSLCAEEALKSFSKFGGTPYIDIGGGINIDDGLFVPKGELNSLRRGAVELLDRARAKIKNAPTDTIYSPQENSQKTDKTPKIFARFENAEQIPENLQGIDAVIFPLEKNPEALTLQNTELIVDIPRGISDEKLIENRLDIFKKKGFKTALCGNLAAVEIAQKNGFDVMGDTGLNISNSESLKTAQMLGINSTLISVETALTDILSLNSSPQKGIVAYGNIPLMLFKNCPLKNGISCQKCDKNGTLTDRTGTAFPVRCRMGYSELLNSVPIFLADRKNELKGLDFIVLYFTKEDKEQVKNIISKYKNGSAYSEKYTRGLYYRGTI